MKRVQEQTLKMLNYRIRATKIGIQYCPARKGKCISADSIEDYQKAADLKVRMQPCQKN